MKEEDIKKQAKEIIDEFMKEIENIELKESFGMEREEFLRDEKGKIECDKKFPKRMLKNAPKVKDDEIVAEKKTW